MFIFFNFNNFLENKYYKSRDNIIIIIFFLRENKLKLCKFI